MFLYTKYRAGSCTSELLDKIWTFFKKKGIPTFQFSNGAQRTTFFISNNWYFFKICQIYGM